MSENNINENQIRIIHEYSENEPFLVIDKPAELPSAPLCEGDYSALTLMLKKYPQLKNVKGKKECEYGLLHRLDTATRGLLLIASSQKFYDDLNLLQKNGCFVKTYKAECNLLENINKYKEGFPEYNFPGLSEFKNSDTAETFSFKVESRFRYYSLHNSQVRPVTENSGKAAKQKAVNKVYCTQISLKKTGKNVSAICEIKEGFKHQVRCHLAFSGFPVINDKEYNPLATSDGAMKFEAVKFNFNWNNRVFEFSL